MKPHYFLLILIMLTASCGFHLRGSQTATVTGISSIAITNTTASETASAVTVQLEASGSTIVTVADKPEYYLQLSDQVINKSVLSVSPITGKVTEYQLTLTVNMSVTDANQTGLLTGQSIRVTRDYTFDDSAVLGSVADQHKIEQEMIQQAASQIVRRLGALVQK
jgi:LPS-assembly lipoprotein